MDAAHAAAGVAALRPLPCWGDATVRGDMDPYVRVKNIRRATRKQYSSEEKIRVVPDGLRTRPALRSCVDVKDRRPRSVGK